MAPHAVRHGHRVYCLANDHANSKCAPCGAGTLQICSLGAACGAPRDLLKSVVIKSVPPHIPQPHTGSHQSVVERWHVTTS